MKVLIQRVLEASVKVDGKILSRIEKGFLIFLGIHQNDTNDKFDWFINKILHLRIFEDENGKMNKDILQVNGEILLVSQFTLYGNCLNGRRPDFIQSAKGEVAKLLYEEFVERFQQRYRIKTGLFGADMKVALINDGPVTFIIEN